jgi:hypothetical protein
MPVGIHVILGFALQIGAFIFVYFSLSGSKFFIIVASIVATLLVRFAYRRFVPAECKGATCGGRAYQKGSRPLYYECSDCGHVHTTNWYEGSRRRSFSS